MGELLQSKKFIAALVGVIAAAAGKIGLQLDEGALAIILSPILTFILGQAHVDRAVVLTTPPAPPAPEAPKP